MSGDYTVADTLYFLFTTRKFTTGSPFVLAGTPVISAYENESLTQITAGITLGVDHDSVAGLNLITVVASGANGFESGKDYHLVITTGTVDSVSVVGEVVGRFTLQRSAAAVDLANGTDGLGAIKTDTAAILVDTGTTLDARIPALLVGGRMDSSVGAMAANVITAAATAADFTTEIETNIRADIAGIGTAGGAAINTDATTDNASGGISGVTAATTKVGTQTNTYTSTSNVNLTYHSIAHSGNAIDWVYQFLTGGGTSVVDARWTGYIDGSNDTVTFYAWNHVGGAWESLGTQAGQAGTTNVVKNLTLYARHRGTSAAELGKVYIRIACTAQTSPTLYTDQLYVSYAVTSRSVGYALGAVWIDTTSGVAGTESFYNGVADNPVLTLADALTIATANLLRKFEVANGSTITLASATANKVFNGHEWNLALGGQNIASSMFIDANVSGTGTGSDAEFETCEISTATVAPSFYHGCGFSSTFTVGSAGNYFFYDCHSSVAGTNTPTFDLGAAVGATNMSFRRWSGGATFNNIAAGDVISMDCVSGGTITLNGADGNVQVRGMCNIVDNRTGAPTLGTTNNMDARFDSLDTSIAAILVDTGTTLDGKIDTIDTVVDAIKAKTDSLAFTVAGQVDANIQYVNDVLVNGDGSPGTEWGP